MGLLILMQKEFFLPRECGLSLGAVVSLRFLRVCGHSGYIGKRTNTGSSEAIAGPTASRYQRV